MLIEGIRFENNQVVFDFNADQPGDIIPLKLQKYNDKFVSMNNIPTYYAYRINPSYKGSVQSDPRIATVRDAIKNVTISREDYVRFITKAFINFDQRVDKLSSYDLIVLPQSSSPLLVQVVESLGQKYGTAIEVIDSAFVKNKITDITVDPQIIQGIRDKYGDKKADYIAKRYADLIKSAEVNGEFKMKKIPTDMGFRRGITNFLHINDNRKDAILKQVYGGKILIVDDIITSGTTMVEMKRLLDDLGAASVNLFCILGLR
jgi:pyrimidine operon attenuation protein/uracil phosphoribosyltransferase